MTKREFKKQVRRSIEESVAVLDRRLNSLLKSGTIDLQTADIRTCKAATRAFLLEEADQFKWFIRDNATRRKEIAIVRSMRYYL